MYKSGKFNRNDLQIMILCMSIINCDYANGQYLIVCAESKKRFVRFLVF